MRMEPLEPQPETGRCRNCGHRCRVTLGGRFYDLCAQERDDGEDGGEIYECDPEETECWSWHWDGLEL